MHLDEEVKDILAWFLPSFFGVAAQIAYDSNTKKITFKMIISSIIVGTFIGYFVKGYLTHIKFVDAVGYILAGSGFLSKKILSYIMDKYDFIFSKLISGLGNTVTSILVGLNNKPSKPKKQ